MLPTEATETNGSFVVAQKKKPNFFAPDRNRGAGKLRICLARWSNSQGFPLACRQHAYMYVQLVSYVLLYVENRIRVYCLSPSSLLARESIGCLTTVPDRCQQRHWNADGYIGKNFHFYVGHFPLAEVYLIDMTYQELELLQ